MAPTGARDRLAVLAARLAGGTARRLGRGGTSLPGLVARWISPGVIGRLAGDLGPIVLVSGTNGKTTTALTLAIILRGSGRPVVANASGANLAQAIGTSILAGPAGSRPGGTPGGGRLPAGGIGVFEVDEAALPAVLDELPVSFLLLTNLFRDQLDRFGETDRIVRLWRAALDRHPATPVVYCGDDPRLAALVAGRAETTAYGLGERPPSGSTGGAVTIDVTACPVCGGPLHSDWTSIGHLGAWRCDSCSFARPRLDVSAAVVEDAGLDGQTVAFRIQLGEMAGDADRAEITARLPMVGTANAYNAAGALAAAVRLGVEGTAAVAGLAASRPAFARWERLEVSGRAVVLSLVKNPASLDEVTRAGAVARVDGIVFAMNDSHADGRDVSWYWDADPTPLVAGRLVAISGARGPDLLLRLRYALVDDPTGQVEGLVGLYARPIDGLDAMVERIPPGGAVLVVSTYTALLGLRAALVGRGLVPAMPT